MAKKFNLKNFIINTLRRASYRYPGRTEAMRKARIDRGLYQCAHCKKCFGPKQIKLDHIIPVVGKEGFIDWNTYINRMFPEAEGFQVLCENCHDLKTLQEDNLRKVYRDNNKELTKPKKKSKVVK